VPGEALLVLRFQNRGNHADSRLPRCWQTKGEPDSTNDYQRQRKPQGNQDARRQPSLDALPGVFG
jgi:hypothetical protein